MAHPNPQTTQGKRPFFSIVMPTREKVHLLQHALRSALSQTFEAYEIVTSGSYIVATDGIMRDLYDVPQGNPEWTWDNPSAAAHEFVERHPKFILEQPAWPFIESALTNKVTHWPDAWMRKK